MTDNGVTPAEALEQLGRLGVDVTERTLVSWRQKGWLPPLERVEPTLGTKDARYVWRDPDIALRIFTLLAAKKVRGRMETAVVMAWLAGFDYPIAEIRALWASYEELMWHRALRHAGAGLSIDVPAAVDVLVAEARATREGRKRSHQFVNALVRLDVDPDFDPATDLSLEQAEQIRRDLALMNEQAADLMKALPPELLRKLAAFLQDYYSAPRLAALIRSLPVEELIVLHSDSRFVLGLYRGWLHERISNSDAEPDGLLVYPRLAWNLGHFLLLVDLAMRRVGLGPAINATVSFLESVGADTEVRKLLRRCRQHYEEILKLQDPDRIREDIARRAQGDPDFQRLSEVGDWVFGHLSELWAPIMRDISAQLEELLDSTRVAPASTT